MGEISFQLDVPIGPDWRNVELLRTSILNCLAAVFRNHDFCHSVGMIAGELIENAIKYGEWMQSDPMHFKLRVQGNQRSVDVEVSNPIDPTRGGDHAVFRTLEWLRGYPSPKEAYYARLREVAERPGGDGKSGLGLVRIAYEGECDLSAYRRDGNVLHVRATTRP